jgi:hypothetical protein
MKGLYLSSFNFSSNSRYVVEKALRDCYFIKSGFKKAVSKCQVLEPAHKPAIIFQEFT